MGFAGHLLIECPRCRRIFPPTNEELDAAKTLNKESLEEVEGSGVIVRKEETEEPQSKKVKTDPQDAGRDGWEAVEKPSETTSERATELSEEGEKVEGEELAESDGEKVEKPKVSEGNGDGLRVEDKLAKDW